MSTQNMASLHPDPSQILPTRTSGGVNQPPDVGLLVWQTSTASASEWQRQVATYQRVSNSKTTEEFVEHLLKVHSRLCQPCSAVAQEHDETQEKGAVPGVPVRVSVEPNDKGTKQNATYTNHHGNSGEGATITATGKVSSEKPATEEKEQHAICENHEEEEGQVTVTGETNKARGEWDAGTNTKQLNVPHVEHIPTTLERGASQMRTPKEQCSISKEGVSKLGKLGSKSEISSTKLAARKRRRDPPTIPCPTVYLALVRVDGNPDSTQNSVGSTPGVEGVTEGPSTPGNIMIENAESAPKKKRGKKVKKGHRGAISQTSAVATETEPGWAQFKGVGSTPGASVVAMETEVETTVPLGDTVSSVSSPKVSRCLECTQSLTQFYAKANPWRQGKIATSVKVLIRKEVAEYCSSQPPEDPLAPFSWGDYIAGVKENCPLLYAALLGALTKGPKGERASRTGKMMSLEPVMGGVVATVIHQRGAQHFRRYQTINSLQLRACGAASVKILKRLRRLGLTTGKETMLAEEANILDALENRVCAWRSTWETEAAKEPEPIVPAELTRGPSWRDHAYATGLQIPEKAPPDDHPPYTYTLCVDDVQYYDYGEDRKKRSFNSHILTLACMDRIPPEPGLSEVQPSIKDIKAIPLHAFLPSRQDVLDDFQERKLIISRVITKYLKCFKKLRENTAEAIKHPYMEESAAKSIVAPISTTEAPLAKGMNSDDVSNHLTYLQKYVPHCTVEREDSPGGGDSEGDRQPSDMILFVDQVASWQVDAVVSGNLKRDPNAELSNFLPSLSDYHKNAILLQDAFHDLLNMSTDVVPGTMMNMKRVFELTNANIIVRKAVKDSLELMELTTEAYILEAAMDFLNLDKLDGGLNQKQLRDPRKLLSEVSEYVARLSNETEKLESVVRATAWKQSREQDYRYCLCKRDRDDGMVVCGNEECPYGTWFHFECLRLREKDIPKGQREWYCSRACHGSVDPLWKGEADLEDGAVDHIFEYTKAVLWHGVNILARHDAIGENDGPRMIRHWKYDLLHLFARGDHRGIFKKAQNFVLSVEGGCSERVAHQLTWSRTVNPSGEPGKNVPINQHMIRYKEFYKDALRIHESSPPAEVLKRRAKILLCVGERMAEVYDSGQFGDGREEARNEKWVRETMKKVTKVLRQQKVSSIIPGRYFLGFTDFVFNPYNIDAKKLRKTIKPNADV